MMTMHDNGQQCMNIVDDNCDGNDEDRKKDTSDLLKNIPHKHHHDQCDDHHVTICDKRPGMSQG